MTNSRLGLLLATSFGLLQYNCLPGLGQTHQQTDAVRGHAHGTSSLGTPSRNALSTSNFAPGSGEYALLFFSLKNKDDKGSTSRAPAAALTIHPVLPLSPEFSTAQNTPSSKPTLVAMKGATAGSEASLFDAVAQATDASSISTTSVNSAPSNQHGTSPESELSDLAESAGTTSSAYAPQADADQSTVTISDSVNAGAADPEPTPIAGTPHGAADKGLESAATATVPADIPATPIHSPAEITNESKPQAQIESPEPKPLSSAPSAQPSAVADADEPQSQPQLQPQITSPEPKPLSSAPSAQPSAVADADDKTADKTPVATSDARPPAPIFMNTSTQDSTTSRPAPVPIAALPQSGQHHVAGHTGHTPNRIAPDQLIAQANQVTASPIPPVVSGTIDLEEFKSSNVIDLKVSQSRTFRLRNKIVRTSISDPSIAEPVVVSENQIVLLGKSPGGATLVVWDDAGNSLAVDLHVERDFSELQATLREIDPRIIVKPFSVGGSDRVILLGDVDHAESVIRAFSAANAFMDDRGMKIIAANSRLIQEKVGETPAFMMSAMQGMQMGGGSGGMGTLSQVNNFMYFSNLSNNVSKAQAIVSDGGRVTSLIKVRKVPLIALHCQFLEMNSAAVRELGIQLGMNLGTNNFAFGIGGQNGVQSGSSGIGNIISTPGLNGLFPSNFNAFSGQNPNFIQNSGLGPASTTLPGLPGSNNGLFGGLNTQLNGLGASTGPTNFAVANSIPTVWNGQLVNLPVSQVGLGGLNGPAGLLAQSILFGLPGGATFNSSGLANLFSGVTNLFENSHYRFSLNPTVNGIISHSRARVLAEPTLVTMSGERAAFLAGGEIPIEQSIATAGTAQQSVTFEPFGLRLNMIPVLLENGTINIEISPEERLLSVANSINLINIGTIPGFTTRKLQTIVELKPGQELFISGLVSANSGRELDKTPIMGEIPVLGALYKSKAFAKNESELVVSVRPEIIIPGNPGQLKLPEEISRSEAARDTNIFQVEPTIIDERYMTSGRAERTEKIPGTLPPGAPIPDNQ